MHTQYPVLGIDISKRKCRAALIHDGKTRHKSFANSEQGFEALFKWLERYVDEPVHACMEATSTYGEALAFALVDAGHQVSIVNPMQVKAFGQSELIRAKTDKVDAALVARFCAKQVPALWTPPPEELRTLKALVRRLESLQDLYDQEYARLEAQTDPAVRESISLVLTSLKEEMARIQRSIDDHLDRHPELKHKTELLASIPGIAQRTAVRLLAEIGSIERFKSARHLAAFVGLTPNPHQSGNMCKPSHIDKIGHTRLRKALYMPALVAQRHNPVLVAFKKRLTKAGKRPKVVIVAIMRKLLHMAYGILKSGTPFDPKKAIGT
jgi:transposase